MQLLRCIPDLALKAAPPLSAQVCCTGTVSSLPPQRVDFRRGLTVPHRRQALLHVRHVRLEPRHLSPRLRLRALYIFIHVVGRNILAANGYAFPTRIRTAVKFSILFQNHI